MLKVLGMDRGFLFGLLYIRNKNKSILMHHIFIAITIPMQHATSGLSLPEHTCSDCASRKGRGINNSDMTVSHCSLSLQHSVRGG